MIHPVRVLMIVSFFCAFSLSANADSSIKEEINWAKFLSKHDLVFDKMPERWEEAPYFGNGFIGSMVYGTLGSEKTINIQIFRTDVQDHRNESAGWAAYSRPRLMIGHFELTTKGKIKTTSFRQRLYTADLYGDITTTAGVIKLHHFVSAESDAIYTKLDCKGMESYTIKWIPQEAKSTRRILFPDKKEIITKYADAYGNQYNGLLNVYQPNPSSIIKEIGPIFTCTQNLLAGGQYVVGMRKKQISSNTTLLVMTIKQSYPQMNAQAQVMKMLSHKTTDIGEAFIRHKIWWNNFYKKSFLSISDKKMERLYWLQLYKIGSANRANGPIMDTSGPWLQDTPWPYITWDLNVQLCYWMMNTSNHVDLAYSLPNSLARNASQLIKNVFPIAWRKDAAYLPLATAQDLKGSANDDKRYKNLHSNLPWAMHNVWLMYRHNMDQTFLRDKCYPLLKRSMAYYIHLLKKDSDGNYYLPVGYSPEYPGKSVGEAGEARNTNIDLALMRWGLGTLLECADLLNLDRQQKHIWADILNKLADYPIDETGFMIGDKMPYLQAHRHYSHLLMIYPLYVFNIDTPGNKAIIERSLDTWMKESEKLQGYSFTGAASIAASIGEGNQAIKYLSRLNEFLLPNGLYKEKGPCFETPLSAGKSIQDMLLQSWGNKIRIFPAVPNSWKAVNFHKWIAEGGFEVSAKFCSDQIEFISVKSLAGSPCVVKANIKGFKATVNGRAVSLTEITKDTYRFALRKNDRLQITPSTTSKPIKIMDVN
ncbi:glycoside hydrolase family 95-like protein [Pedobacter sp. Leaf194]|uniref:glycosyl hydrolase family 95 catalytic domain-containing protein n=1 Tax=Pedobacter sp. Leaf194 TaxID=1736297 RepID=UPI000702BE4B|nr:hypothetical protein [Pedobacter sp. Leaf194]KQS36773.1 hypothetical protein ASG14_06965 [Pedobacter sp. Leaf194]